MVDNSRRTFIKEVMTVTTAFLLPGPLLARSKEDLPKVLILGDSISIGYTPFVKELLKYSAEVMRPVHPDGRPENCEGTTKAVKEIRRWLGDTQWDVIHFNFGLHDIKHVDAVTGKNSNNPDDPPQADLRQYKKNLNALVVILKATGAKLIFATTTPYPDILGGPLRDPGMYKKYNHAAVKIMHHNKISVNRLDLFMEPRMEELQKPENVHFTEAGSKALAQKVAERITEALNDGIF